jgi:hypothetical protein
MKNRNTPLRSWSAASYGLNGRAASAFAPSGSATSFDGEPVRPTAQISEAAGVAKGGAPNFHEWQATKTQGGTK